MNQDVLSYALPAVMQKYRDSGLASASVTFKQVSGTQLSTGQLDPTLVEVTGLTNIACQLAPLTIGSIAGSTQLATEKALSSAPRHLLLDGYYGDVAVTDPFGNTVYGPQTYMKAVIDGVEYSVIGVDPDSQKTQTRLWVRVVSLGEVGAERP